MCNDISFMKKPCKDCPFRTDVIPFLHPKRAEEIAYSAENSYSSFSCHKTLESDGDGQSFVGVDSKECAGFLTLRAQLSEDGVPSNFEPSWNSIYVDSSEMIDAYKQEWNK